MILDRDGTLIVERHHLCDPDEVELIQGVSKALCEFKAAGMGVLVGTNQSVVGRGYVDLAGLKAIHKRLDDLLRREGASVDQIYFCPHTPEDQCLCRKPNPLLVTQAATDWHFDLETSFVVGDQTTDIQLGKNVSATTILVNKLLIDQALPLVESEGKISPDYVVDSITDVPSVIRQLVHRQ